MKMTKLMMPQVCLSAMMVARPDGMTGNPRNEADGRSVEQLLGDVQKELTRVGDDVAKAHDTAEKETKRIGEMSAGTKNTVDQLLTTQGALQTSLEKLTGRLEATESQQVELEQKMVSGGGRSGGAGRQTLGQAVVGNERVQSYNGQGALKITVENAITTATGSGGDLRAPTRDPEVVGIPRQTFHMRDLIRAVPIDTTSVEYARQTLRTNNAAMVAEGNLKPESFLGWGPEDAQVRTIATFIHVSRQAMDDLPMLQGEIDGELRYMLDFEEDTQILMADGVAPNLDGLVTNATAYSGAAESKITNPTIIDKLRVAMLEASLNLYPADGVVLNDEDWMVIETTKDAENRYIFANPTGIAGPVLWGRRVVPTLAMSVDKFLVGAFQVAATIYDRMDTEVLISSEDRDNFIRNMLTVRAEKRMALAVKRPASLIYGDFGLVV